MTQKVKVRLEKFDFRPYVCKRSTDSNQKSIDTQFAPHLIIFKLLPLRHKSQHMKTEQGLTQKVTVRIAVFTGERLIQNAN